MKPEQYHILWTSSWIALFPCLLSIYFHQYGVTITTASVYTTSILYWRHPIDGWRKYLDESVVRIALIYQLYIAYYQHKIVIYSTINSLAILIFYLGQQYYYKRGLLWHYTYCHFTLHLLGNLSNFYLLLPPYPGHCVPV